jgi:hypothetical protein
LQINALTYVVAKKELEVQIWKFERTCGKQFPKQDGSQRTF